MKQPYNTTIYNTALYLRLSRDDELQGESGSIQTQRMMLRQYAAEHGLTVVDEYIDDGWSGTNFERPSFQRMIDDIEDGKINCVVTKDLSRLGRNYILTGQYTEIYFPSKGVRYIAINDNVDTINGESELAPFLNILNEMHARQTSKKVKAAMHTRFANGAHYGAYAPLGYVKDPDKKGHLLIDPETRWIVEKIFDLAVHGRGAASITRILVEEKVPTPGWLNYERYGTFANIYAGAPPEKAYAWTIAQVKSILKEETYIGHSVHNKQSNISFKNKKKVRKPQEEWYRVENTHEAIISEEVFQKVQELIASRRRKRRNGTTQIFAGLIKCADCGWSLAYGENKQNKNPYGYYHCSKNGQGLRQCSMHYIRYDVLYAYVLARLQYWSMLAQKDEDKLLKRLLNVSDRERNSAKKKQAAELKKAEKRKGALSPISNTLQGRLISSKLVHPANALLSIVTKLSGKSTLFKFEHPENVPLRIHSIPLGNVILVKLEHPTNALPNCCTLSGIATLERFMHSANAPPPILVTVSGIIMSFNCAHCAKAQLSITVTFPGITTLRKAVHPSNTLLEILSRLSGR